MSVWKIVVKMRVVVWLVTVADMTLVKSCSCVTITVTTVVDVIGTAALFVRTALLCLATASAAADVEEVEEAAAAAGVSATAGVAAAASISSTCRRPFDEASPVSSRSHSTARGTALSVGGSSRSPRCPRFAPNSTALSAWAVVVTYITSVSVAALDTVTSTVEITVDVSSIISTTVTTFVATRGAAVTVVVLVTVDVSLPSSRTR